MRLTISLILLLCGSTAFGQARSSLDLPKFDYFGAAQEPVAITSVADRPRDTTLVRNAAAFDDVDANDFINSARHTSSVAFDNIVRFQDGEVGGAQGGGGGSGGGDSNDPTAPIIQLRFQNQFQPGSFDSSGYSNEVTFQAIIPLIINEDGFFPFHILRPTTPLIAPTADPDGTAGVQGGLGDTTLLDIFIHPVKEIKTNFGVGYVAVLPTATHPQLGLREWKFGPSAIVLSKAIPKWLIGGVYYQPFSLQSDAYQVLFQPLLIRNLPNKWFVGIGDLSWKLNDENGEYDLPLSLRVGKVAKIGRHEWNIFVQPFYTPPGLHKGTGGFHRSRDGGNGGGSNWGIKIQIAPLLPGKLYDPVLSRIGGHCCCE